MQLDALIRPMRAQDVPVVERLSGESFFALEQRSYARGWPDPTPRGADTSAAWARRLAHTLEHDPGGCWVAEDRSGLVGAAAALKRDLTWVLATFVVRPDVQGRGVGRQLLDAALTYGDGCLRGMLSSTADPRAARRYRLAGFTLHPSMFMTGTVAREVLPVVERVREGSAGDIDLMDSVDRQVRDAAHGVDHEYLTKTYRLVVVDRSTGSGYAYVDHGGGPHLLAATNRRTATDLLWETLAASSPDQPCQVSHLTAANAWAMDVGLAARMDLHSLGYLALRSLKPPAPYLHSGYFL